MMLQLNLRERRATPEGHTKPAIAESGREHQQQDDRLAENEHGDEEKSEEDEAFAREQIKRMMNKMQEMRRKHQEQQLSSTGAPIESDAINVNCRRQSNNYNNKPGVCEETDPPTVTRTNQQEAAKVTASHELIKRRFFEKLERRKSMGNSTTIVPAPSATLAQDQAQAQAQAQAKTQTQTRATMMMMMMRNFTTHNRLSNLREETESAYGFCSPSGCEIVVERDDDDDRPTNKVDYLNNNNNNSNDNRLFVCDSAQISRDSLAWRGLSALESDDVTCQVKNDNALTGGQQNGKQAKEEAVYLTLDWKNVQVNGPAQMAANESNNKEQSVVVATRAAQNAAGPWPSPVDVNSSSIEQKQIKPLADEANKNNKPQPAGADDTHSEYKHPIPVGQEQQVSCRSPERATQVLVGRHWRTNEADLVILPKKSVNSNNKQQPTPGSTLLGLRKGSSSVRRPGRLAKDDENSDSRPRKSLRRRRQPTRERSCSTDSGSSLSSSSSGLTLSPSSSSSSWSSWSSSSSLCSSSSPSIGNERVPGMPRLEQLSLSEDDLKSLISHSNSCRCCECSGSQRRPRRACRPSHCRSPAAPSRSSQMRARKVSGANCVSPDQESAKKDDSSNSSSGNSSATRSLLNSLFHRGANSSQLARIPVAADASQPQATKSVPNLVAVSGSLMTKSRARTGPLVAPMGGNEADSAGKFWSLFGGSIGPSHANTSLPLPPLLLERPKLAAADLRQANARAKLSQRREKQTSDERDSSQHIYSSPLWQPKTAGYRLHLPVARPPQQVEPQQEQPAYATLANSKYHSCGRHRSRHSHHHHHHHPHHHRRHHHQHEHHGRHHSHRQHHHHERDARRSLSTSRHAHGSSLPPPPAEASGCVQEERKSARSAGEAPQVWGQLIEINKLDGSQVLELERQPGKSWGFFVARGAINRTKGIFVSRMQDNDRAEPELIGRSSPLAGLLGVGDRLLAIDGHQIGPDYDILRVNRLISKRDKILLKVKPFKG